MKTFFKTSAFSVALSCGVLVAPFVQAEVKKDVVDTAVAAGSFKTLAAAVTAAGLVDALKSEGPFTVFAPTDEAFAKLPAGTVETLLKPENKDQLAAILKYHVVAGRVYSDGALKLKVAKTLEGSSIEIRVNDGKPQVNNANLVALDIDASNGVIHVIDAVILPPEKKKVSAAEGRKMIEHAVSRGSKMYNSGDHAGCAQVYTEVAKQMLELDHDMSTHVMLPLNSALTEAGQTHCPTSKSWTLREGLDKAYYAMSSAE